MTASTFDVNAAAAVVIAVVVLVVGFLLLVLLLREPRSRRIYRRTRVGVFVERDHEPELELGDEWTVDGEDTVELPPR